MYYHGNLAGAALFGYMAGNHRNMLALHGHDDQRDYRELMRLVLLDHVPKNSETRFVAWCLRELKRTTDLKAIISYADPRYGHTGTIYRAGNWIYTGPQEKTRPRMVIDGAEVHPRQAYDRYGTASVERIRALGHCVELHPLEPKHRYIYLLRPGLERLLKYPIVDWRAETQAA